MYKIYDLECTNKGCGYRGIELIDIMVNIKDGMLDIPKCDNCSTTLGVIIGMPKGYVKDTENRCIQK